MLCRGAQDACASWEGFIENKNGVVAQHITGKDFLPTEAFTEDGIDSSRVRKCEIEKFQRKTNESVFNGPHLLIRKVVGAKNLITKLVENRLVFKSDIYSIHAPKKELDELRTLANYIVT